MNGYETPNLMQALNVLNELLDLTTTYDLTYARDPEHAQDILTTLKAKVQSHYQQSPQPVHTYANRPYPYDLYHFCLYNLHHNPLVPIEFGSQSKLNQSYIQQIIQTRAYFQTCTVTR
ncbi:TPA: hypothetical protein R1902_000100 [Staphylococcus delphini]|nr:hypothetical protein [Staphylococcus delphini]HEC2150059.1 hypothetical protein [Staphylococcus delphini]HEC2159139.1 hypothetical protein [Staphylococcus delphini]HEC2170581.1 hypothetical protein [Staphylococcus delphini]HEC2177402.1 hypothetical protein [Staphylococcus delphini]